MKLKDWFEELFIILVFAIPLLLVPWADLPQITDFSGFYAASALMQSNHFDQIYNPTIIHHLEQSLTCDSARSYLPFLIPPMCLGILFPLAWLKFKFALFGWVIISLIIVTVSYAILCSVCAITGIRKLWLAAFIAGSGPYIETIRLGQTTPILLLSLTLLLLNINKKHSFSAAIFQYLLWLKPFIVTPIKL